MQNKPTVLLIGVDPTTLAGFEGLIKNTTVVSRPLDVAQIKMPLRSPPELVIACAESISTATELSKIFKTQFPRAKLFLGWMSADLVDRDGFFALGYSHVFFLPAETEQLKTAVSDSILMAGEGDLQSFQRVKLVDIDPGETVEFDIIVYLPSNNKHVRVVKAGDQIDSARLEHVKGAEIYVPAAHMQKFYEQSARKLRNLGSTTVISKEERKAKLVTAVKDLMSGLFSESMSQITSTEEVMKNCSGIVSAYIDTSADAEWYTRIQQALEDLGDRYSHSANVSTLAALFSIGLGIGKPEDLALAGLLHDIGKVMLPDDVQGKEACDLNPAQYIQYKKHPEYSIEIIKQKKLAVPNSVIRAILQHHEYYNGMGFPKKSFGPEICKEAQLVGIADLFDQITKKRHGHPTVKPAAAVEMLRMEQMNIPSKKQFDPALLKSLLALFPQPNILV